MVMASLDRAALLARFWETPRDRERQEAQAMRRDGMSLNQIARILDVSRSTVQHWTTGVVKGSTMGHDEREVA